MPSTIEIARVRELLEQQAQLVEVLPAQRYAEKHLPGALSIPLAQLGAEAPRQLDPRRAVITYCYDTR